MAKQKLNKKESDDVMPIIREFNKIAEAVTSIMGQRVKAKERKISVLVSKIKRPDEKTGRIKMKSVEFSSNFLKSQKGKKKKDNQSEWDDNFSQKKRVYYLMILNSKANRLKGVIDSIPGDKSISHRSIIISSLAKGTIKIKGFLCSDDCLNTLKIFQELGVNIRRNGTEIIINSNGIDSLKKPEKVLDVGNSGTGIRLISGVLAALPFDSKISGDHSIIKRPMKRIIDPLTMMGAKIDSEAGLPPLSIFGNQKINSIEYNMPIASAQVKSAILFAG